MPPFKQNPHITFRALVALEPLVSLMSRLGPCRTRISGHIHTHTHTYTHTHKPSTVTLAVHVCQGLTMGVEAGICIFTPGIQQSNISDLVEEDKHSLVTKVPTHFRAGEGIACWNEN